MPSPRKSRSLPALRLLAACLALVCLFVFASGPVQARETYFGDDSGQNIRLFMDESQWKVWLRKANSYCDVYGVRALYEKLAQDYADTMVGRSLRHIPVDSVREIFACAGYLAIDRVLVEDTAEKTGDGEVRRELLEAAGVHEDCRKTVFDPRHVMIQVVDKLGLSEEQRTEMMALMYRMVMAFY